MALRLGTFNIENLLMRFDFSGFRNTSRSDRVMQLFDIATEQDYERLEGARIVATTDDMRQLTAQAISELDADILCLQEVDNIEALNAFEHGYLYKMMGENYRRKYLIDGNDSRGIDVAIMMRDKTADGETIEFVDVKSHAHVTYRDFELFNDALLNFGAKPDDRIFKRDCLEVDVKIDGKPLTIYVVHFKSMQGPRELGDGRASTMPIRIAEIKAVRKIISDRFGADLAKASFAICGDMNDYQERVDISGSKRAGFKFFAVPEEVSALSELSADGFAVNVMKRRDPLDRWTHFHTRGPEERHLCQLDYIWLSAHLAVLNPEAKPDIVRAGQPFRTIMPPGQDDRRFPRVGWDRPKASDHCPVVISLDVLA